MSIDFRWLAGFFDGEGCITIRRMFPSKNNTIATVQHVLYIAIGNTHEPTIRKLQEVFGSSVMRQHLSPSTLGPRKSFWLWSATSKIATEVLEQILPYLEVKEKEALLALDFVRLKKATASHGSKLSIDTIAQRDAYYWALRHLREEDVRQRKVRRRIMLG